MAVAVFATFLKLGLVAFVSEMWAFVFEPRPGCMDCSILFSIAIYSGEALDTLWLDKEAFGWIRGLDGLGFA